MGKAVWVLLALALVLRLALLVATWDAPLTADPADYDRHARSIASGQGYPESEVAPAGGPTAVRPPGYPYLLGLTYAVTGQGANGGRLLQSLLGTGDVALIGLLGWRLWGRRVGVASLGLAAVFPPLIVAGASLFTEPLFLVFMLGALLAVLQYRALGQLRWTLAGGTLLGLAVLTRENGLALVIPLALGVWTHTPRLSWRALAPTAVLLATAALVVAPWTVRNALAFDEFVPVTTTAGYTLAGTYSDTSRTDRARPAGWRPASLDPAYVRLLELGPGGEAEVSDRFMSAVADYVRRHPVYVPTVAYKNTLRLLHLDGTTTARLTITGAYGLDPRFAVPAVIGSYAVFALGLAGAFTRAARHTPLFFWLTPILLFASVVLVRSLTRFRLPVDPFLILLAALGLVAAWAAMDRRRHR